MAMLPGDYTRRTLSTQRNSSLTGGSGNSPVHIPAGSANFEICPQGSVLISFTLNATSGGTDLFFQDSAGTRQVVAATLTIAADHTWRFYCPWPLYVSTDVDCLAVVSSPGKNITGPV